MPTIDTVILKPGTNVSLVYDGPSDSLIVNSTEPPEPPPTWDEVTGKPTTFPPSSHGHPWTEISGKPSTFPPTLPIAWTDVSGKPATFPPAGHIHPISDVTGLQPVLDGKVGEAPVNGTIYARQNAGWVPAPTGGGGGGIPEAPTDGQQYARQNAAWTVVVTGGGGSVEEVAVGPSDPGAAFELWYDTDAPTSSPETWDQASKQPAITYSNNNQTFTSSDTSYFSGVRAAKSRSAGTFSFEVTAGNPATRTQVGICKASQSLATGMYLGMSADSVGYFNNTGQIYFNGALALTGATWTTGDIIKTVCNVDAQTVSFYKNGALQGTISSIGAGPWFPAASGFNNGGGNPTLTLSGLGVLRARVGSAWQDVISAFPPVGSGGGGGIPEAPTDGQQYARQSAAWTVVATGGGSTDWSNITNKPSTFPPTVPIAQADITNLITDLDGKVAATGDTMTGNLVVSKAYATLCVDKPAVDSNPGMLGRLNGLSRWFLVMGDLTAESGSNAGSNFIIARYDDAGAYIDTPFTITRNSGEAYFTSHLWLNGGIMNVNSVNPRVTFNKQASGEYAGFTGSKGWLGRWQMLLGDQTAESGGNTGSHFKVNRHADDGNYIDSPFWIDRATGYNMFNGNVNVKKSQPRVWLDKAAVAETSSITGMLNSLSRWQIQLGNGAAETGGNLGNDFAIQRFDDAGAVIDAANPPIVITRNSGVVNFARAPTSPQLTFFALTDAATIAIDWNAAINFMCTNIAGNRILGTPSNAQQGTYRTVYVGGVDATPRTLTFTTAYKGVLPTLTDLTTTKAYLLTIFCINPGSHFLVTSLQAVP